MDPAAVKVTLNIEPDGACRLKTDPVKEVGFEESVKSATGLLELSVPNVDAAEEEDGLELRDELVDNAPKQIEDLLEIVPACPRMATSNDDTGVAEKDPPHIEPPSKFELVVELALNVEEDVDNKLGELAELSNEKAELKAVLPKPPIELIAMELRLSNRDLGAEPLVSEIASVAV